MIRSERLDMTDFIQGLLWDDLVVPMLPEVALRVVRAKSEDSVNARRLAAIIEADPALTMHVLRIARSAAKRPAHPILSLSQAIAWLGLDEVSNIAFTLGLQGRILAVPGHQDKVRRLWRHSLAGALWSRRVAQIVGGCDQALCYLCGLLHDIGKMVTLSAVHDIAQRSNKTLTSDDYDRLIDTFHRQMGARVIAAWALPKPVQTIINAHLAAHDSARAGTLEGNILRLAHLLADGKSQGSSGAEQVEQRAMDQAYAHLGLNLPDAALLVESASAINAELDEYWRSE
jgi:putative nucleotidyltransferase with HDIG domain